MRTSRWTLAAAAAIIFSSVTACAPKSRAEGPGPAMVAAPPRGSVVYLEGSVKIDGKEAEIGQVLQPKARIETANGSSCEVVFGGKNAFKVGQNAVVLVDFSKSAPDFELQKGGLTSVLKKLALVAGQDSYTVRTSTAVAGVRGTSFCVWADAGSTYVCACNGSVRTIDTKGGNEMTLQAAHHTARIYSAKGATIDVEQAGVLHHDDATIEGLAARIGEKVDWTKIE